MRTNVVIDDRLMSRAVKSGGYRTKRAAIEAGLSLLLQVNSQRKLHGLRGKVKWYGNLEEMRRD
ncbi:MAG TPA: type II toxin-antitoxin system VapB family antitoxin [Planctomycetota bacterium]|jgi:Arc/MetJ family transcription regulator